MRVTLAIKGGRSVDTTMGLTLVPTNEELRIAQETRRAIEGLKS